MWFWSSVRVMTRHFRASILVPGGLKIKHHCYRSTCVCGRGDRLVGRDMDRK